MKKSFLFAAISLLAAQQLFATYFIVLRDGTKYRAKDRWTIVNGKALITLENGSQFAIDPTLIDPQKTDAINKSGLGDATLIGTREGAATNGGSAKPQVSELGELTRTKKAPINTPGSQTGPIPTTPIPPGTSISQDVLGRIPPVYENVGLFGSKVTAIGPASIRVELVADSEDQVFKAISATAYLIVKLPSATGARIDDIDLVMTTVRGGAAGRFNMKAADAQALESRQLALPKYYVDRVIF